MSGLHDRTWICDEMNDEQKVFLPRVHGDGRELLTAARSPHWHKARELHLKLHPVCAACGGTEDLEVHHKKPFHLHPELELNEENLITLCENQGQQCHFHFGHCALSWKCYNPHVEEDAELFLIRRKHAKYE